MRKTIARLLEQILDVESTELSGSKACVDELVSCLHQVTGVELYPDLFLDTGATTTPFGKVVSMTTAAQCANEYMRTQVFIRGVYQAICEQLQYKSTMELPYAVTGPFGLLVVPLLTKPKAEQIRVTLLDINPESLQALSALIDALGGKDYIRSIECTDIVLRQPLPNLRFDLIVSEAMKAMLAQEPQVAIFRHLTAFLRGDGQLIPQQISIDAWLSNDLGSPPATHLGNLFCLALQSSLELVAHKYECLSGDVVISSVMFDHYKVKFTTSIQVYGKHRLDEYRSSLNLPRYIHDTQLKVGSVLKYSYRIEQYPRFEIEYVKEQGIEACSLQGRFVDSSQGIPYLKRPWHKVQLLRRGCLDEQLRVVEAESDAKVIAELGIEPVSVLAQLFQSNSFDEFDTWLTMQGTATSNTETGLRIREIVDNYHEEEQEIFKLPSSDSSVVACAIFR